jgi:hypothetical protein
MKPRKTRFLTRLAMAVAVGAALAGCSALEVKQETVEKTNEARKAPESTPYRSITNFSGALRCMDTMMIEYGVRDVSVLVENILDQTKKVSAGTKDMLISAVSDMTRRSRSVRLVAYGPDSNNLIGFLHQAQRKNAYAVIPQYDIKGSITQLDENLIRNQKDFGIGYNPYVNLGIANNAASMILGLDLTVLNTEDLSVLSGVTSRNSVILFKEGSGFDADAAIRKFGVSFNMSLSKTEAKSQALRNLVELAVIELFGKLTKTPYWTCLGADSNEAEIRLEISDWYYAMASNPPELIGYFQRQLRRRGYYNGPVDGVYNAELADAVAKYRSLLGLSQEAKMDQAFFAAYLNADHAAIRAKNPPPAPAANSAPQPAPSAAPATPPVPPQAPAAVAAAKPAPGAGTAPSVPAAATANAAPHAPAPAAATALPVAHGWPAVAPPREPLAVAVSSHKDKGRPFKRGEPISLTIAPNRDAHVYCYLQDETRRIQRFFPNRFQKDTLVRASTPLQLPGSGRYQLVANDKGVRETVACFAAEREIGGKVPGVVAGIDFEHLQVTSLARVKEAFAQAAGNNLATGVFHVDIR